MSASEEFLSVREEQVVLEQLWHDFKETGSSTARDRLILHYSPLVKYVANRVFAGLPQTVDSADLVSYGVFGLIDAIEKFEPSRNIKFETYAISRIRGAIIDELRSLDWVPRSLRAKAKDLERAYVTLEHRYSRSPTDAEVAYELEVSEGDLQNTLAQLSYTSVVALDELWNVRGERGDKISLMETIEDTKSKDPEQTAVFEETKRLLNDSIDKLPPKEKIVIALYYYENLTLREIGEILSITESRVSQLHTKAVLRLKGKMEQLHRLPDEDEDEDEE